MKNTLILLLFIPILSLGQKTYVPDNNFEQALVDLGYDNLIDDSVITANINTVTSLDINNESIYDLTGIEGFTALTSLHCYYNQLTSLDLSTNNALTSLFCYNNQLTSLDITNNTNLTGLFCHNNQLTSLDLRNGNNSNLTLFYAIGNLNLSCIAVDDPAWSTNNWITIDSWASFATTCSLELGYTYVPDNNFEQALIDLGYDSFLDDYVLTTNINTVMSLDINNKYIADLTGIEDFTALSILGCQNNQLINLDLSNNIALTELFSESNQLTSLNLKNGNNINMSIFYSINNPNLYCIEVDDSNWSSANWTNIDPQSSFDTDCSPECTTPSNFNASDINESSANLNWINNSISDLYNIEYGLIGFTIGSGTQITGTGNTANSIIGLSASTTYEAYIQSDCGINESNWTGPVEFTTTIIVPTTQLEAVSCNTSTTSLNDLIKADAVASASNYRFRFINGTDTIIVDRPFRSLPLSLINLSHDITYSVDLAVTVSGIIGVYGTVCTLTTPSFPITQLETIYCGSTPSSLSSSIKADAIASATGYRFRFRDGIDTMTYDAPFRTVSLSNFNLNDGTIYIVDVAVIIGSSTGPFGPLCTITTQYFPTTQLETAYCGIILDSLTGSIKADAAVGATAYRFRFINGTDTIIYDAPYRTVALSNFTLINDITYNVDVAVIITPNIGPFGIVCTVTTPLPTSQLELIYCGTIINSLTSSIQTSAVIGANGYRFRFINGTDTIIYDAPFRTISLSNLPLVNDLIYNVDVAVTVNNIMGLFGPVCTVQTPTTITQLSAFFCGSTVNSLVSEIKAVAVIGATNYRFRFIYGPDTMTYDVPFRTVNLSNFDLTSNTIYNVDVAVTIGATIGSYGPVCTITTPDFPTTQLTPTYCGITVSTLTSSIKAIAATGASAYRFRFINGVDTMTYDVPYRTINLSNLDLISDVTYNVDVAVIINSLIGQYGTVCSVTTPPFPTTQLTTTHCGSTPNSLTSSIQADAVIGADGYRFRFINGTDTMTYDAPFRTVNLSNFALTETTLYFVDVAIIQGSTLGQYSTICTLITPITTTQLEVIYCNITVPSLTSYIKADVFSGATNYRFRFINGTDTMIYDHPYRTVGLSNFALSINLTYDVDVSVTVNGIMNPYGSVCTITTPGTAISINNNKNFNQQEEIVFEITSSPNPFIDATILHITSHDASSLVSLLVYDGTGRLIESRLVDLIQETEVSIGKNYNPGFYQVITYQNGNIKTARIIKQ